MLAVDPEGILAIIFIFGGGTLFLLAVSPVGKAIADRIRHGTQPLGAGPDPEVLNELESLRNEMTEPAGAGRLRRASVVAEAGGGRAARGERNVQ